jgi:hypothetical protein
VGPISFWGYKEQESNLILPEHDDDDDDDDKVHLVGLFHVFIYVYIYHIAQNVKYAIFFILRGLCKYMLQYSKISFVY